MGLVSNGVAPCPARNRLKHGRKDEKMANIERTFEEYGITVDEQRKIMDVMDKYRNLIAAQEAVNFSRFENDILDIFGGSMEASLHIPPLEYHFCEFIAKDFMEDGRWEEVFPALYGQFPKYGGKITN